MHALEWKESDTQNAPGWLMTVVKVEFLAKPGPASMLLSDGDGTEQPN
jgi:hypothetical protein